MMVIFAGPTLLPDEAPDFEFRPPAAQGDLYRAAQAGAAAIGLVDGYFDEQPAVWHKEILWALREGTPVYGAASIGALRAAELHAFGMRGVGRIFEAYRDGRLIMDDAVALLHGPPETRYVPLSLPLVNIEATLVHAVEKDVIAENEAAELGARARALQYRERTWSSIANAELAEWLRANCVDQKKLDALKMVEEMRRATATPTPAFAFQQTALWQDVVARHGGAAAGTALIAPDLLDEIRLSPDLERFRWPAMARRLVRRNKRPDSHDGHAVDALRQQLALYRRDSLLRWLQTNRLTEADFQRLAAENAAIDACWDGSWLSALTDEMRLAGRFESLLDRAEQKRTRLENLGREDGLSDHPARDGLAALVGWFCERRGIPFPEDCQAFGTWIGFAESTEFRRALARERLYCSSHSERDIAGKTKLDA